MATHQTEERRLAAIMFTDIVGYGSWTQGDEAVALALLDEHNRLLRTVFPEHGGREIKSTGDGFLVEFASAVDATRCAIQIQRCLADRNASVPAEKKIQVRIGLHVGDVVHRDNDLLGDGVNIAARIRPLARPGGICLTQQIVDQVQHRIEAPVVRLGKGDLKHVRAAQAIYRVALPWEKERLRFVEALSFRLRQKGARELALAAGLLVTLVGMRVWQLRSSGTQHTFVGPPAAIQAVAVLPFANTSPDRRDEYLSDGVTDEIIGALDKVAGLRVTPRTSSFAFKGKKEEIGKVAEQLQVGSVVEGTVQKVGSALRVTARLVNIASGASLWSESYNLTMADLFATESAVAQRVAAALRVQLRPQEKQKLAQKPTENVEAYDLYMKGRFYQNKRTGTDLRKSLRYFDQAIEKQSDYARAYAGKADSFRFLSTFWAPPREVMPKAKEAAQKALELDPTLAEAHTALGNVFFWYDWDWPSSEREFRRALKLNPRYADAYEGLAYTLTARGKHQEAIALLQRAVQIDPLSPGAHTGLAGAFFNSRQYDQAIQQAQEAVEVAPNFAFPRALIGLAYAQKREYPKAIAALQSACRLDRSPTLPLLLAYGYALAGRKGEARTLIHKAEEVGRRRYICYYEIAAPYVALGEKGQAFKWFDKALEQRCDCVVWTNTEPMNDQLRSDPRFTALVRKLGLEN